jgi:cytoskeletal protein CcmA (bactofilin family)
MFVRVVIPFVLLLGAPAVAQDEHPGEVGEKDLVSLPADAVINKDYFAYGKRVEISGTVNGDVYVAGGQILVDGQINGDLLAAGGKITISGRVSQDVRVAGGRIAITGVVGRNLTVAGGEVDLTDSAAIHGGVVAAGGSLGLAAPIGGDAMLAAGHVTVSNRVGGSIEVATGDLRLTSKAAVSGDVTYRSSKTASIDPGATIGGVVVQKSMSEFPRPRVGTLLAAAAGALFLAKLVSFVSTLVLGLLFLSLFPRYTRSTIETLKKRPWVSLGLGFVVLVITPIVALLLLVTLLGAPLALILTALYLVGIYLGRVFVILWAGMALFAWRNKQVRDVWALVVGLVVYSVLTVIPFIGGLVTLFVILFGLGAILLADRSLYVVAREKEIV